MTPPTPPTLTGRTAISVAERLGLTLGKYADPTEEARTGLTVEQARDLARQDPALIWIDGAAVSEAIDDAAIHTLSAEAATVGDWRQVHICTVALADHETCDYDGGRLVDFDGAPTTRSAARVECARSIADARARSLSRISTCDEARS